MIRTLVAAALALSASFVLAQSYPSKPIRVVVPFAPGGPVDVVARLLAPKMNELLGQSLVIENKAGAGGNLGVSQVARSAPDGYTVLMTSSSFAVNPALTPDPGYNAEKDFTPIAVVASQPNFIVVNASFPARTLAELLQMARTQKLAFASPSSGTTPHLTAENLFRVIAKVDIVHVPHKGAGPAALAVLSGEPPIGSLAVTAPIGFIRAGQLRALAISSAARSPQLPDVPTFTELGYPQIQDYTWVGFFAPAGTPPEIVAKLNDAMNRAIRAPDVREKLEQLLFEPVGGTPQQFSEYVRAEVAKWGAVVKQTGAKVD